MNEKKQEICIKTFYDFKEEISQKPQSRVEKALNKIRELSGFFWNCIF